MCNFRNLFQEKVLLIFHWKVYGQLQTTVSDADGDKDESQELFVVVEVVAVGEMTSYNPLYDCSCVWMQWCRLLYPAWSPGVQRCCRFRWSGCVLDVPRAPNNVSFDFMLLSSYLSDTMSPPYTFNQAVHLQYYIVAGSLRAEQAMHSNRTNERKPECASSSVQL